MFETIGIFYSNSAAVLPTFFAHHFLALEITRTSKVGYYYFVLTARSFTVAKFLCQLLTSSKNLVKVLVTFLVKPFTVTNIPLVRGLSFYFKVRFIVQKS